MISNRVSARHSARTSGAIAGGRKAIAWRMVWLVAALNLPLLAVAARLVQWQVVEHDQWLGEAEGNQRRLEPTRPPRGLILWSDGEIAAGEVPVFSVQVIVEDIAPDAWVYAQAAHRLECPVAELKRRLTQRGTAAVEAVAAVRREAWLDTCRALVDAANGEAPAPEPVAAPPPRPGSIHENPFRPVAGAVPAVRPIAGPVAHAAAKPELLTLPDLLFRAAKIEADAVQRMNREWARIVGLGLRDEGVTGALQQAREVAAIADELHASWVYENEQPALLPYPSKERLAAMAQVRREELQPLLPAGAAARRRMEQQMRDADRVFERYLTRALRRRPLTLLPSVTESALLAIEIRGGDPLPGVHVRGDGRRVYPAGTTGAHVIGFVGLPLRTKRSDGSVRDEYEEQESAGVWRDPLLAVLDDEQYRQLEQRGEFRDEPFGKTGLERTLERLLRGEYGIRITDRDRYNRLRKTHMSVPATRGAAVRMTLRRDAQAAAERILASGIAGLPNTVTWSEGRGAGARLMERSLHRGAAAVVLDIKTGAVIVAASVPGFNPNHLVPPVSSEAANELYNPHSPVSRYAPMLNRTIQGSYAPGSIMKIVTMAGALHWGVGAHEGFTCDGTWQPVPGGITLRCMHACGHVSAETALQKSCNIAFFQIGYELKQARMLELTRAFGFGNRTGSGIAFESAGNLPDNVNAVQLAIGQGRLTVTPMQVARMCAAVANGGRLVVPHLLADQPSAPAPRVPFLTPEITARIHAGMVAVVHSRGGTAYKRDGLLQRIKAAGKTGTAEKIKGVLNTVWFAGYAPYDDPQVAFAVVVEDVPHGGYAGTYAAPIAAQIVDTVLNPTRPAGAARVAREGR